MGCFKCTLCGTPQTLETYYNHQQRQEGKEVYCRSHVPKIGPGHLDGSAVGIRSAVNVPRSANFVNEQIRGSGKGTFDAREEPIDYYLIECIHVREQPRNSNDQASHITVTAISIEEIRQDVQGEDRATTSIKISKTAPIVLQTGKFSDYHFEYAAADDELVVEVDENRIVEEMQRYRVNSDANLHKTTDAGSVPVQEDNDWRSLAGRKRSHYLDENSTSDNDSCMIIDTDDKEHRNTGSNNVQEH